MFDTQNMAWLTGAINVDYNDDGTVAGITVIIINNKCCRYHSHQWALRVSYVPGAILRTWKILTLNLQNNPIR